MNKQKSPVQIELEKYKHELATLKSLKMHISDVFDSRIEIVQLKIAECVRVMKEANKETDNENAR